MENKVRNILLDFGHAWDVSKSFGENEVKEAKSALLKAIEEKIRTIKGEWSKNPKEEISWMIKRTDVLSAIEELFNAK